MIITESRPKKNLISLTSLIDVVFILLVFFMLSSTFTQWNYIALDTAGSSAPELKKELLTETENDQSHIHIHAQQQYQLNNTPKTLDEIIEHVLQQRQQDEDHHIVIKANDDVSVQHLVTVLDAIGTIAAHNMTLEEGE